MSSVGNNNKTMSDIVITRTKKTIPVSCVDASINADGTVASNTGFALYDAQSGVSSGDGANFGPGNRYTVAWDGPAKESFSVLAFPKDATGSNNGLIPHEVSRGGNSVTLVFRSGDDGGGADESILTDFDIVVTGGACEVVEEIFVNGVPVGDASDAPPDDQLYDQYVVQQFSHAGFFNTDQMNAQLQVFNIGTDPGISDWTLKFSANYDVSQFNVTGATAGQLQQTDNGDGTYLYTVPMSGAIPGNNGNIQIAITGTRHPNSNDTTAASGSQQICL